MENKDSTTVLNIETNSSSNNINDQNLNKNPISSEYDFALLEETNQKRDMFKKNSNDLSENIINTENSFETKKVIETDCNLDSNRFKDFDAILEETKEEDKKYRQKKCKSAKKIAVYKNYINDLLNEETKNCETDPKINENKNDKNKNELDIIQEDIEKEDRNTLNAKNNENELAENKNREIKDNNEINNNENTLDEILIKQNNMNNTNSKNKQARDNIYYNNYISSTERVNDNNTNVNTYINTNSNTNTNRYSYKSSGDIIDKLNHLKTENNISTNPSKSISNINNNDISFFNSVNHRLKQSEENLQYQNINYTDNNFYKSNSTKKNRVPLINFAKSKNNVIETIVMTTKKPKQEKIVCDSNRVYVFSLQKMPRTSKKYSMTPKNLINNYLGKSNSSNDFNSLFINFNSTKLNSSNKNSKKMSYEDLSYLNIENKSLVNINLSNAVNNIKIKNIREKLNNNFNMIQKRKSQQKKILFGNKDNILGNLTTNFMKKKENGFIKNNNDMKTVSNNIKKIKQNIIDIINFGEMKDDFYNPKKKKLSNFQKYNNLNDNRWSHSKWINNFNKKLDDKYIKRFNDLGSKLDTFFNDIPDLNNIEKIKIHTTNLKSSILPTNAFQRSDFKQTKKFNRWFNY